MNAAVTQERAIAHDNRFDDAFDRARGFVSVMHGLAVSKIAEEATHELRDFWGGIETMTKCVLEDLEAMRAVEAEQSNQLFDREGVR